MIESETKKIWLRLKEIVSFRKGSHAEKRVELLEVLRQAKFDGLLDSDALSMIEGVFQVSELSAKDILLPRAQIDWVDLGDPIQKIIPEVIAAAHSRFPVFENNRDNVVGVLLAKDLLRHGTEDDFDLKELLRPAVFIPESKRLGVLLKDFRSNRNHLAIVVDEYGGVAGIITIEDEHDIDDEADNIVHMSDGRFRVRGMTSLEQINEVFETSFIEEDIDTIAGLVIHQIGKVPKRGEVVQLQGLSCEIQRADPRQIHILIIQKSPPMPG